MRAGHGREQETERIWETNRRWERNGGQKSQEALKDKKGTEFRFPSCILAALTPKVYDTVDLDSGSEARYVRRHGRGLGI